MWAETWEGSVSPTYYPQPRIASPHHIPSGFFWERRGEGSPSWGSPHPSFLSMVQPFPSLERPAMPGNESTDSRNRPLGGRSKKSWVRGHELLPTEPSSNRQGSLCVGVAFVVGVQNSKSPSSLTWFPCSGVSSSESGPGVSGLEPGDRLPRPTVPLPGDVT